MGACDFAVRAKGKTAQAAFSQAVQDAQYESGHGGYTGTIAEKHGFILRPAAANLAEARTRVRAIAESDDPDYNDKWGPAICIPITGTDEFVFCGLASS
jgi:hypothetical protein